MKTIITIAALAFTATAALADRDIPDECFAPVMSQDGQTILYWNVPDQNCAGIVRVGNLTRAEDEDYWSN